MHMKIFESLVMFVCKFDGHIRTFNQMLPILCEIEIIRQGFLLGRVSEFDQFSICVRYSKKNWFQVYQK